MEQATGNKKTQP